MASEIVQVSPNPSWRKKLQISTITEGLIRYEWAAAKFGQIIPINWESSGFDVFTTIGYSIDDAYNLVSKRLLDLDLEWLLIIEDDVIVPADFYLRMSEYINKGDIPVVSGLYYLKAEPTQPLIFRGRGNGAYTKWKLGDKVWADGLPMGCILIHASLIKWAWDNSEEYIGPEGSQLRRAFESPRRIFYDPELGMQRQEGTQDLFFFDRLLAGNALAEELGGRRLRGESIPSSVTHLSSVHTLIGTLGRSIRELFDG